MCLSGPGRQRAWCGILLDCHRCSQDLLSLVSTGHHECRSSWICLFPLCLEHRQSWWAGQRSSGNLVFLSIVVLSFYFYFFDSLLCSSRGSASTIASSWPLPILTASHHSSHLQGFFSFGKVESLLYSRLIIIYWAK